MSALVFPRVPIAGSTWVLYRQIDTFRESLQTPAVVVRVVGAEVREDDPLLGTVAVLYEGKVLERELWVVPNIGVLVADDEQ